MPTQRQLSANRRNAKKCTGPLTPEGKARSSRNNLKHGLYSKAAILPTEDSAARAQLAAEYQTACPHASEAIEKLTESEWLLRRYSAIEATIWNRQLETAEIPDASTAFETEANILTRIDRYRNHAAKEFRLALHQSRSPEIPTVQPAPPESLNTELVSSRAFDFHRI